MVVGRIHFRPLNGLGNFRREVLDPVHPALESLIMSLLFHSLERCEPLFRSREQLPGGGRGRPNDRT
jgi:hypothetical protein